MPTPVDLSGFAEALIDNDPGSTLELIDATVPFTGEAAAEISSDNGTCELEIVTIAGLSGAASAVFASSGRLTAVWPLTGEAAAVIDSEDCTLANVVTFSGAADAEFDGSVGDMLFIRTMTGAGAAVFASTANLQFSPEAISGSGAAVFAATAALSQAIAMTGAGDAVIDNQPIYVLLFVDEMMDYDGANDGVFTHGGVLVKHYNLQGGDGDSLDADVQEILDAFQLGDRDLIVEGLPTQAENWVDEHVGRRTYLAGIFLDRLRQRESVLEEIGAVTTDINEILPKLTHQMIADGESVKKSVVSISYVTAGTGNSPNTGTGTVLTCKLLDGITSPGRSPAGSYLPCEDYAGLDSQLALTAETMRLLCVLDSDTDGATEGSEQFAWTGWPEHTLHGLEESQGSGNIGTVTCANAANLLFNLDFETTSAANTPASWNIDTGTAGTHVFVTSSAGDFFHGDQGLKFTGTGALAAHQISQTVTGIGSSVKSRRLFCVALHAKADATIAQGDFTCQFQGTGYSAATGTVQVQTIQISGTPSGNSYTISWNGQTTGAIAWNAASSAVQAALRLLTGLESVVVATSAGSPPDVTHQITMHGVWGNPAQFTTTSSLTGGTPVIAHATTTPGVGGERIYLPAAALPTTWSLRHFWIVLPDSLPDDFELVLKWTGTPTNAKSLYIDDAVFKPADYGGGIAVAVVRGAVPFVRDDRFSWDVANDNAGVFQTFFRDVFGFQLPSSASPTIADALAE